MGATEVAIKTEASSVEESSQENKSDVEQSEQQLAQRNEEDASQNAGDRGANADDDDEPEEGEIVDDYEFIISSDEELCMRQRIEELEAKNDELEKIANISGNYENDFKLSGRKSNQVTTPERCPLISIDLVNKLDCQRAAQVPTDASSISSAEFPTPKKRRKKKSKVSKAFSQQEQYTREQNTIRQSSKHHPRHYQQHRDLYRKHKQGSRYAGLSRMRYDNGLETIYLDSEESSDDDSDGDDESACYLSRVELRLALARSSSAAANQGGLKDRLEIGKKPKCIEQVPDKSIEPDSPKDSSLPASPQIVVDESDDSMTLEEHELRLIALKSAVMKKHLARKKRDAEVAYSPTDFDDLLASSSAVIGDDDMDVVEIDDSRHSMEISPVASPKLHLSPLEDENSRMSMATESNEVTEIGDTKPIDMDIANSESDEELPAYENDKNKWMPIEQIPLPSMTESNLGMLPNSMHMPYNGIMYPTPIPYQNFYPDMHMEPPPLPPGVADFDLPPLPPKFRLKSPTKELSDIKNLKFHHNHPKANDEAIEQNKEDYDKEAENYHDNQNHCSLRSQEENVNFSMSNSDEEVPNDDEEEEEALRSLLLSKFNSPKNSKSNNSQNECKDSFAKEDSSREGEDPEALRSLLLTSISDQKPCQKPTEAILKEAVRRLTMKNCIENQMNSADSDACSRLSLELNSQSHSPIPIDTHSNREIVQSPVFEIKSQKSVTTSPAKKSAIPLEECVEMKPILKKTSRYSPVHSRNDKCDQSEHNKEDKIQEILQLNEQKTQICNEEAKVDSNAKSIEATSNESSVDLMHVNEVLNMSVDKALKSKVDQFKIDDSNNIQKDNIINNAIREKQVTTMIPSRPSKVNQITENVSKSSEIPALLDKLDENKQAKVNVLTEMSNATKTNISALKTSKIPVGIRTQSNTKLPSTSRTTVMREKQYPTISVSVTNTPTTLVPSRSKKFIKPNKVINTQNDSKRKSIEVSQFSAKKLKPSSKPASPIPSASVFNSSGSRLITNADLSAVKVNKLIITLRASDTETSEDEFHANESSSKATQERLKTLEPLECTINNDYYDNASPISLPMDSPADTPRRANSPETSTVSAPPPMGDCFEKKLDTFLKTVRSQVQKTTTSNSSKNVSDVTNESNIESDAKAIATPVAVRHLPHASQEEYRRLVHRMQMLEKQKQTKKNDNGLTVTITTSQECEKRKVQSKNSLPAVKRPSQDESTPKSNASEMGQVASVASPATSVVSSSISSSSSTLSSANGSSKTLIQKVLIKNASNTILSAEKVPPKTVKKAGAHQPSKSNVLRAYESSFLKTGAGIVSNLEKSLHLVEEAKQAKMAKLRYEKRLNDLRAELEEVQRKFKHEQQRMSKIFPQICESNEVITTLKQRRMKLLKAATSLGKSIKGDDYRLNNDLKHQISIKSKKLASEIKVVNSMKYVDIEKITALNTVSVESKQREDPDESESPNEIVPSQGQIQTQKTENIDKKQLAESSEVVESMKQIVPEIPATKDPSQERSKNVENTSLPSESLTCGEIVTNGPKIEEEPPVMELSKENDEVISEETKSGIQSSDGDTEVSPQSSNQKQTTTSVREYISPLAPMKTEERQLDPNGIICPYDLMGECVDKDCSFVHLKMEPAGSN